MVAARALLAGVLAAVLLAACAGPRSERTLPLDRTVPVLYVALGDSTVEGIGASRPERNYVSRLHARLREVYPAARVANLGAGGATSADVVVAQLPRAVELGPHLVTLSVGPNDITSGLRVAEYERNVDAILRRLVGETPAVVVVNLLPDLAVTPRFHGGPERDAVGRLTLEVNAVLRRQAREHRVEIVDLYGPSRDEVPRRPDLIAGDGYHPSDAGYARWADLMWHGVAPRIVR